MRFIYTKTFVAFVICLVVGALLVFLQSIGWLDPIKQVFLESPRPVVVLTQSVARPVKNFFSTVYGLREIARQNTDLKQEVSSLQQQLVDYDQEKRENDALRSNLGFVNTTKFTLVPCTVLSQNPAGLTDTLVLNCGTDSGVAAGQAVLSQGFLVAKIVYTSKTTSTALLATNSNFTADAELSKTGAVGLVTGSFGSGLLLDRLPQSQDVEKGWYIVTAGINEQVPRGVLIGQVGDIISSGSDLFKKTTVLTPVDFNNLDFVFVAKP